MKIIETERWVPSKEDPSRSEYIGQRTGQEVFEELRQQLENMGCLPDEYFLLDQRWENGREIPEGADIFCTTDYGASEGIYLDVYLKWYEDGNPVTKGFITGKTLGESGDDLDRMFLISSAITKAFHGDGASHARYIRLGESQIPASGVFHLSLEEQKTIIDALITQHEKYLGLIANTESLLRRMTGGITQYIDQMGRLPLQINNYDQITLAVRDGNLDAFKSLLNPVEKRHIVSVFKLVQELLAPSRVKGKNQFQLLLDKLPPNHKAKWFAGSALNTAEQAMASVLSTVLSRLNAFLDSEMEQILCFDTAVDAEKFCNEKSAIFVVLPEEDTTKYFMVSLIIQNLYREILTVADENGGRLKNRVVFFADELGSCPPIQSLELMFSASRSRGLMLVPIVQSITGQLQKNYGKEGSEIIVDNCQVNIFGGFAPASQTAEELSKALGSRTVMSGSISRGKNDPSQSLQMMERPLMTPDELKSMPKGSFIVAKTGVHPMRVRLRLFLDWGIRFGEPYEVPEKAQRPVAYADKQELEEAIIRRHYASSIEDEENQVDQGAAVAGGLSQGMRPEANRRKPALRP